MLPMTAWLIIFLLLLVLAWRALKDGGWFWAAIGGVALAVFGAELWGTLGQLAGAVKAETFDRPVPVLHLPIDWRVILALAVFFRPMKRRAQ